MATGGAGWVSRCGALLMGSVLGCGASADGTEWGGGDDPGPAEQARDAEADALIARFVLPDPSRLKRLQLVDEIDALAPELSRRFQYRLLDYTEAHSMGDPGSGREMRRALIHVGIENELFGLNLPAPLIEEAMWRAFAPQSDEWGAERVEALVEMYTAALSDISPRARRDKGLPVLQLDDAR